MYGFNVQLKVIKIHVNFLETDICLLSIVLVLGESSRGLRQTFHAVINVDVLLLFVHGLQLVTCFYLYARILLVACFLFCLHKSVQIY